MASRRSRFVFVGVVVLLVASLWRSAAVEREKHRLAAEYDTAQETLGQLNAELIKAHGTIDQQAGDLTSLHKDLQSVQERLDETMTSLASLQREHEQLRQHDTSVSAQLNSVQAEKQQLEAKLSSIKELKLAIQDIKRKMRDERLATWRSRIQTAKAADQQRLASGNHGFVVREGFPTLGTNPRLHVRVLEPEPK